MFDLYHTPPTTKIAKARIKANIAQNTAWYKLGLSGLADLLRFEHGLNEPDEAMLKKMAELYGERYENLVE
ncbi:hypothetical protein [Weissella confusa]|uniref:Uncharacterized protein n=1 Tax=Weissella confusa TaxID=1583 RepID=A0AA40YLZ9_WEICO|nr:hypothetical protein [Weissella confusa]MBJ7637920.1 hypothetical protein [Weissella confusa]